MKIWHAGVTLLLLLTVRIFDPFLVESLRLNYFDSLQRSHPESTSEQIVLVDIDEKSIQEFGQWPWPRKDLAYELNNIPPNNLLALSIVLSEKDRFDGDWSLAETLQYYPSILATAPTKQLQTERELHVGTATLGKVPAQEYTIDFPGILLPWELLEKSSDGNGAISAIPDIDGVVRKLPIVVSANDKVYPSFALEILRVAVGDISYQIKTNEVGIEWVRIPKYDKISTLDDGTVYNTYWNKFERVSLRDLRGERINPGSILIVGATFEGTNIIPTPVGAMYPHDIQANLVKTIIDGTVITRPSYFSFLELISLLFLGLLVLSSLTWLPSLTKNQTLGISVSGIANVLLILAIWGVSSYLFSSQYLLFDPTWIIISLVLVFSHGAFIQFYTNFKLRQQIKKQFETYLDPRQVYMLQKDPSLLRLGGERKEMTFLFMDICGFTPVSEHYKNNDDPEGLVELINMYLDRMTQIILKNEGTIDKYMGDCIMAFWNAPLDCPDHAQRAVKSAKEISEAADELIKELEDKGLPRIDVGIGINSGECIVGNMGSKSRFDYSVIGDAVNLASRLEGQTRNYDGVRVLLSARTAGLCKDGFFTKVDSIQVKGKSESIEVLTI
jgi:adenylate cyclase